MLLSIPFLFWFLLWVPVLNNKYMLQFQELEKLFSQTLLFWHPFQCTHIHRLLEKLTLFTWFLVWSSYPHLNESGPPGYNVHCTIRNVCLYWVYAQLNYLYGFLSSHLMVFDKADFIKWVPIDVEFGTIYSSQVNKS